MMLIQEIESYLSLRRSIGYKLQDSENILRGYALFAAARGESHVCIDTAIEWASHASSLRRRDRVLRTLLIFVRFARAENNAHELPPADYFSHPTLSRRLPFIFTPYQVQQLVEYAGKLRFEDPLRSRTYYTLFGLLASCGLRISEAMSLKLSDHTPHGLHIRETKFHKSRLVPLHPSTARKLADYRKERERVPSETTHLFIGNKSHPLNYTAVRNAFRTIIVELGLEHGSGQSIPRIHDLRHTFAVRALESSPDDRNHIARHMLALSTYLGHTSIKGTYWYLQSTPQLLTDIADQCEQRFEGDIP